MARRRKRRPARPGRADTKAALAAQAEASRARLPPAPGPSPAEQAAWAALAEDLDRDLDQVLAAMREADQHLRTPIERMRTTTIWLQDRTQPQLLRLLVTALARMTEPEPEPEPEPARPPLWRRLVQALPARSHR